MERENLNPLSRINCRASLVTESAVITDPIAYIRVVAVKKVIVGLLLGVIGPTICMDNYIFYRHPWVEPVWNYFVGQGIPIDYCEKIRVFKEGACR